MSPSSRSTPRKRPAAKPAARTPAARSRTTKTAVAKKKPPQVETPPPPLPPAPEPPVFVTGPPPPIPAPPVEEPSLPSVPWRWWESFIVFLLAIATSMLFSALIGGISRGDVAKASLIIAFEVSLGFWAVMWVQVRFGLGIKALGLRTERLGENLGLGVVAGLVGIVVASLVVGQIVLKIVEALSDKAVKAPEQLTFDSPSGLVIAVTAFAVIVAAPIAEELFFRGFVFQGFRRRFGFAPSALLSGAMFGLAHVPFWLIMPSIAALGFILAFVFERRGSLVPTIVAHATFNSIGFAAYLVSLHH